MTDRFDFAAMLPSFMRPHRRAVLLTFLSVLLVGSTIGWSMPRRYVASTDLWLDRGRGSDGAIELDARSAERARNTELRLLTSREMAARTVDALGLDRVPGMGRRRGALPLGVDDGRRSAVRTVQDRLSVVPVDASYAVRIRFRADEPAVAASVANRIADLYVDDRRSAAARRAGRDRLALAVAEARDALLRGDAAVEAYRSAVSGIGADGRPVVSGSDIAPLDAELAALRATALADRFRTEAATAAATARLRELERRQAQRAAEGATGSDAIDRQIAEQRRRVARIAAEAGAADARIRLLLRVRDRAGRAAAEGERSAAELTRLQNIARVNRERYDKAGAALERQGAARSGNRSTAYVITRASAQSARREPDLWIVALSALVAAAAASVLAALALEQRVKGFRTAVAVEHALGTDVLAMVPRLSGLRHAADSEDRLAVPDYLTRNPDAPFADRFRTLLVALRIGDLRQGAKVVAISSALPDEGKTTVALCLARSAALAGDRTVLIDCDVRRPAASRALFRTIPIGLVEVIEDGADVADALRRDPGSDVMVLGIGDGRRERAILLDPATIAPVIERLRQDFDIVVCDCPPALALSEAREAAALADAVLLVVRHRLTPQGAVTIAQDLLKRAGARIAGVVLTMVEA